MLRGALDGLSAVPAYGDGAYARTRRRACDHRTAVEARQHVRAASIARKSSRGLSSAGADRLSRRRIAYRERSHFDGQDLLETGTTPHGRDGWLNRALLCAGTEHPKGTARRRHRAERAARLARRCSRELVGTVAFAGDRRRYVGAHRGSLFCRIRTSRRGCRQHSRPMQSRTSR